MDVCRKIGKHLEKFQYLWVTSADAGRQKKNLIIRLGSMVRLFVSFRDQL